MAERPDIDVAKFREWANGQMTSGTYGERKVRGLLDAYEKLEAERDHHAHAHAEISEHFHSELLRADDAEARERKLREALTEARGMVETWASYAPEWATEKHNLAGDLAQLDAALATPSTEGGDDETPETVN